MKRARRLGAFWNWLPAFRAVAETEHLPTASDQLRVSASALSRTIRLLEEDIGQPLFDRVGRAIRLNGAGLRLLGAVRDAMRLMDEGLQSIEGRQFIGPVHISVPGPFAAIFVLPALGPLTEAHPGLVPCIDSFPQHNLNRALKGGAIDIALTDEPTPDSHLAVEVLAHITHGIYCSSRHPLATGAADVSLDAILAHPFVAPTQLPDGRTPDQFPAELKRTIGLRASHLAVGIDACLSGDYVAVLPDLIADRAGLTKLPTPAPLTPTRLYLLQRTAIPTRGRANLVADALRANASRLEEGRHP